MSRPVACSCGKRFAIRDEQVGRSIRCPACGARLAASRGPRPDAAAKPVPPPSGSSGVEALAAMFNNMTPQGAKKLAAALNAAGKRPGSATGKPHRFGTLGCALPLGLFFLLMLVGMSVAPGEPPPLAARFIVPGLGAVLILFSVWRMWGQWTRGRVVWCVCLLSLFAFMILAVVMGGLGEQHEQQENQALTVKFSPLVEALGDLAGLDPTSASPGPSPSPGLRTKLVPVILTKKGAKKGDQRTPPEVVAVLYRSLPASLKAGGPDEVQTVVLLDYGWNYWGTYRNQVTGNTGDAYVGICTVTVVDRKSRQVVARETLVSPEKPPESKYTAMEWYGSQPSDEDVIKYLQSLPTRYGDLPVPTPPDDGKGIEPDKHL